MKLLICGVEPCSLSEQRKLDQTVCHLRERYEKERCDVHGEQPAITVEGFRNRHGFFVGYRLDGCCDEFLAGLSHDLDEQQDKYYREIFCPEEEWRPILEDHQKNRESTS